MSSAFISEFFSNDLEVETELLFSSNSKGKNTENDAVRIEQRKACKNNGLVAPGVFRNLGSQKENVKNIVSQNAQRIENECINDLTISLSLLCSKILLMRLLKYYVIEIKVELEPPKGKSLKQLCTRFFFYSFFDFILFFYIFLEVLDFFDLS